MLPVNLISLAVFVLILRIIMPTSLLSSFFVSIERFQIIFRAVVFGVPFLAFVILAIIQRTSPKKISFWAGAAIMQFVLFWIITPRFDM